MNSTELATNLFRATQTKENLKKDNIKDLGGTMREDLPTPEKNIKQIEKEESKKLTSSK